MPPYCAARMNRDANYPEYKRWEDRYGPAFLHIHHLCYGIGSINRYYKALDAQQKRGHLDRALSEFAYVIHHVPQDFGLLPELYWYRSTAFRLRGDNTNALEDALKAIELDRTYVRAYLAAADLYAASGLKERARAIVAQGLQQAPESKPLRERYVGLGGKLSDLPSLPAQAGKGTPAGTAATPPAAVSSDAGNRPDPTAGLPRQDGTASEGQKSTAKAEKNQALYAFTRVGRGGMSHGYNAGAYVFLDVSEDATGAKVVFRIISRIPEPHSRIGSIGFDLGRYHQLFTRLETDRLLGQYYRVTYNARPTPHAFWPDFNPHYSIEWTIDPKIEKPNDPRKLSPGNSLAITATLAPGVRYGDVIEALDRGLVHNDGLRVAIIGLHLAGKPLPSGTRMDDGGYFLGRLVQLSGPYAQERAERQKRADEAAKTSAAEAPTAAPVKEPEAAKTQQAPGPAAGSSPRNPWCRFCPTE
ncbi:MAG: hypothetical protein RMK60_02765 [Burkholderiales bacterium]|nr:hypothetical protein [Burkholderiales bacterium]